MKRLLRLVQVASNPAMVDQSYRAAPGKLPFLDSLVYEAVDAGEKIVVWTSFTENADLLGRHLERFGAAVVHGGLAMARREENLQLFKTDPECRILIATPGAAKEGLTLTMANHAVFFDRSFSLDDYLRRKTEFTASRRRRPAS